MATIGTPPQRRSSRLSALRTTITWVSHTWLARRVPFLIMISILGLSLLGRGGAKLFDDFAAQHLARRVGGQLVAKDYPVRGARPPQTPTDVFAQFLGVGVGPDGRHHHRDDGLPPL